MLLSPVERSVSLDLERLRQSLQNYKSDLETQDAPEESLHECIKHAIKKYIETTLKLGESQETLKRSVQSLCHKEMLIPTKLQDWAKQYTTEKCCEMSVPAVSSPPGAKVLSRAAHKQTPLFDEDTLYHAAVCCHAVSTCTSKKLSSFLKNQVFGHNLEEVSVSISADVSRYMIARNGSTLYVALQSEPTLAVWKQKHSTFEEG